MKTALVFGASGDIGYALTKELLTTNKNSNVIGTYKSFKIPHKLKNLQESSSNRLKLYKVDTTIDEQLKNLFISLKSSYPKIDLCISTVGALDSQDFSPEKKTLDCTSESLVYFFKINTLSNLLIAKHLKDFFSFNQKCIFTVLSAKVGSIEDNKMGGWYSYRISKAALNMAIKNISLEFGRSKKSCSVFSIHPGTTLTKLSKKYIDTEKTPYKVHSPLETAKNILKIVEQATPETHNGRFFSWDGSELPW